MSVAAVQLRSKPVLVAFATVGFTGAVGAVVSGDAVVTAETTELAGEVFAAASYALTRA